jgi:hypothetical protein
MQNKHFYIIQVAWNLVAFHAPQSGLNLVPIRFYVLGHDHQFLGQQNAVND